MYMHACELICVVNIVEGFYFIFVFISYTNIRNYASEVSRKVTKYFYG